MKTGVYYTKQDAILGVGIVEENKEYKIKNTFNAFKDLQNVKAPVIGFPFDHFIAKTVKLPKLGKDELKKTIELQVEFLLGEDAYTTYSVNTKLLPQSTGYILFIIAATIPEELSKIKKTVILPDSLGLYCYANNEKIIDPKKTIMLIYVNKESIHLIVVVEQSIAFIRTFSTKSDISSEIKLSEQAVYMQPERCFVKIDEYAVFYSDEAVKKEFPFVDEANVRWENISKYIVNGKNYFLSVGLALYDHSSKTLNYWNIAKKPPTTIESLKRSMFWLLPVLIVFLPLYYYGDYYKDQKQLNILQGEISQISEQVSDVDSLSRQVSNATTLLKAYAGPCLEYAKFYNILVLINKYRPDNLWLTNISGKVSGELVITGFSKNFSEISTFIKKLNTSEFIENLNLNYSNASSAGKVNFQMTIKLVDSYDFIVDEMKDIIQKRNNNLKDEKHNSADEENINQPPQADGNLKNKSEEENENNFNLGRGN